MRTLTLLAHSRSVNFSLNVLLASLWGMFVWQHIKAFNASGEYALVIFAFSETFQALFFLIRRDPKTVSMDPFDWLIGGGGTLVPFLLTPGGLVLWAGGGVLVIVAVVLQIAALFSLNRSFAIVAANRKVKTAGLYRVVRHPMYASYILLFVGYLLFNFTPMNVLLVALAFAFLFLRLAEEEKHLASDPVYRSYMERVRFKLVPFFY